MWRIQESSNGESTLDFLESLKKIEQSIILLDEPETSLSIKSQIKIRKLLTRLSKKNQVIIVTHSPVLMAAAKEVYDFETKEYKKTGEYIKQLYK